MHKSIKYIFTILLVGLPFITATGQRLTRLTENPVIKKYRAEHRSKIRTFKQMSLLTLPFFEDFSTSDTVPDPQKWTGQSVFINNSYGKEPMSIGVATFDAINDKGDVYNKADTLTTSDTLTSRLFDLALFAGGTDTVRLSFFYQAGGFGEVPELKDTFLLQFKRKDGKWVDIWKVNKDTVTPFEQEIIPIDTSFYYSGFQFRFRNFTSTSVSQVTGGPGALGNADFWNLDYIMMDTKSAAEHETVLDFTMVNPPLHLLKTYEIVPWNHLNYAQDLTHQYLHYVIRNLGWSGISQAIYRNFYIKNLQTGEAQPDQEYYEQDIGPDTLVERFEYMGESISKTGNSNEGDLQVVAYLKTQAADYKYNDTAKTTLHFKDYYAYDDGSPEYGFGISGESTSDAFLAYRFRIFKEDTLRGVDIYFNKTRDNYNAGEQFRLCVWADNPDNPGKPGDLIYISPDTFNPEFDGFLKFHRYNIDPSAALIISDSIIYVGWKQMSEDYLNVGYDVNRDTRNKMFVNISGSWFNPGNSILSGSLMIRPVFGKKPVITSDEKPHESTSQDILLSPNPANTVLNIMHKSLVIKSVEMYDIYGRKLFHTTTGIDNIDVSSFPAGIYLVNIICSNGSGVSKKIVISH